MPGGQFITENWRERKMKIKRIVAPLTVALLVGCALPVGNAFGADMHANGVGKISLQTSSVDPDSIVKSGGQVIAASGAGDAGAKIVTAIAACPAVGCVVDARGVTGTISQDVFAGVTKPITLLLGAGTYVVTVQQTYVTSTSTPGVQIIGSGQYATSIDNRVANGAAFKFDGSNRGAATDVYQRGTELRDFSIITTTSPAASSGIILRANMHPTIERVRIQGLTGHGIQLLNEEGDHDATAYLTMNNCELFSNRGWGFYTADPVTSNASGSFLFLNNAIVRNAGGGVRAVGLNWNFMGGSISYNTGYGIHVPYTAGRSSQTMQTLHVNDVEMDGNSTSHVFLEAAVSATFDRVKAITSQGHTPGTFAPAIAFKIGVNGGRGTVTTTRLNSIILRHDGGKVTLFQIADNAFYTTIEEFTKNTSTGVTDYIDAGTGTRIIQYGVSYGVAASTVNNTSLTGSYTPNGKIVVHRLVITGRGAFAMNAPTDAEDGRELELFITNASGGEITITFNAKYFCAGFLNPGSGQRTSARFRYIAAAATWVQVGAWSPPI